MPPTTTGVQPDADKHCNALSICFPSPKYTTLNLHTNVYLSHTPLVYVFSVNSLECFDATAVVPVDHQRTQAA